MDHVTSSEFQLTTKPIKALQTIRGVLFPADISYQQLLVTGPPGAGKSTLIRKIRGWFEEGYVDLSLPRWWASQALSFRPREIHLGFPCQGYKVALVVFDEAWKKPATPPVLDLERIKIPPRSRFFFSVDWRNKFVLEFLIPPAEYLFEQRCKRKQQGTHKVDQGIRLDLVRNQVATYRMAARYLHNSGLNVYIREGMDQSPLRILDFHTPAALTIEKGD